ncbi:serine/threonine-protein kinase [Planobispora takensis]|uniref:non-specific serine/threonine protein kinase n=1 Tax=Planobispora takensis TaxID=1367882 RepID=A0A8J3WV95_9ACTN|nr:serine/threonine-protein kinase [Planobispora takensis]GII02453.1 serine/threonine protein kinase [Planobispora takensis]
MTERRVAGRYHLLEPIGEGGMGVVWRAHDELLDRTVAVKEVRYRGVDDASRADLNRRTIREARTAGRLDHPSVIIVHDVVEEDGRPWIVMQMVRSRSLGEVVRQRGPLPPERVAAIGLSLLGALRAAHAAGVLHRDVKPENVLLADDGRVVLTDFGIASMTQEPRITRTGGMVGTPAFLPPERLHGLPATPESDLWSLGATLYAALEGRPPFERATPAATMMAVLRGEPSPMTHIGPLATAILGLMSTDPSARMSTGEAEALFVRAAGPAIPDDLPPPAGPAPAPPHPHPAPPLAPAQETRYGEPHPYPAPPVPYGHAPQPAQPTRPEQDPLPAGAAFGQQPYPGGPSLPGHEPYPARATRPGEPPYQGRRARPEYTYPGGPSQGSRRGVRLALAVGIPVLVLAVGTGGWFVLQNRGTEGGGNPPTISASLTSTTGPGQTPQSTPEPTPEPTPSATRATPEATLPDGRVIPRGWRLHEDPLGFSVAVPRTWSVKRSSGRDRVEFRDPRTDRFLWIESTEDSETDPVRHWEKVEQGGNEDDLWPGYRRLGITGLTYLDRPAADWEFTYDKAGERRHVLDRGFRTSAGKPYAIYWESADATWNRAFFDRFTRTFRP